MLIHLQAKVFQHRDAAGLRDTARDFAQQVCTHTAYLRVASHGDAGEGGLDGLEARRMLGNPGPGHQAVLHEDPEQGGEAPGVGAGFDRQMIVRHFGRLAPARIDDDQRALRVLLDGA